MGRNNRQRRAAKARKRASAHRGHARADTGRGPGPGPDGVWTRTVGDRFIAAVYAERGGDRAGVEAAVDLIARSPRVEAAGDIAAVIEAQIALLWQHGWQPADLARVVDRDLGKLEATLVRWAIASEATTYEHLGQRVAPQWMEQLRRIEAVRVWDAGRPYLGQLDAPWPDVVRSAVRVTALLVRAPRLPLLVDPPTAWREGLTVVDGSCSAALLEKVRALLAKAESTTYDAEAEALTAKAQELMTRHRIDRALLDAAGAERREHAVGRRLGVDNPYADAKALLLDRLAAANGCRAVWSKGLGFATVFGFPDELDALEELYTSLLVQASNVLRRAGSKHDQFGRSRTTRYRRSFLVAYAVRIGQRLKEAADAAIEEVIAASGTELVPLLTERDDAATNAAHATFPEMRSFSPAATDGEGWHAGTLFGDLADLSFGSELERMSA